MLAIYARLKPGTTIAEARAGTRLAAERLDAAFPAIVQVRERTSP